MSDDEEMSEIMEEEKPKMLSNKISHVMKKEDFKNKIPSKIIKGNRNYFYKISLNNPSLFFKFVNAIASAVTELKISLVISELFTGLNVESHDSYMHIACKSKFSCNIEKNDAHKILKPIHVLASTFLQTLNMSDSIGDSILTITRYEDEPDKLMFECISDENDASSSWFCDLLETSHIESLEGIKLTLHYHVNLRLKSLKQLCSNAKKSGATSLLLELFQCKDANDPDILHSLLCIGFKGNLTSGKNKFYQSAKKVVIQESSTNKKIEWNQLSGLTEEEKVNLKYELKSSNEYDNGKLRMFLNHMDIEWVLFHLCDDESEQPLVLDCILADKNTKHCIIVAPKVKKECM